MPMSQAEYNQQLIDSWTQGTEGGQDPSRYWWQNPGTEEWEAHTGLQYDDQGNPFMWGTGGETGNLYRDYSAGAQSQEGGGGDAPFQSIPELTENVLGMYDSEAQRLGADVNRVAGVNQGLYQDAGNTAAQTYAGLGTSFQQQYGGLANEASGLYGGLRNQQGGLDAGLQQGYQQRQQDVMGLISGLGASNLAQIDERAFNRGTEVEQNAANRGLSASTVVGSGMGAVQRQHDYEVNQLGEQIRREQAGALTQLSGEGLAAGERGLQRNLGLGQQQIAAQLGLEQQGLQTGAQFYGQGADALSSFLGQGANAAAGANQYGLAAQNALSQNQINAALGLGQFGINQANFDAQLELDWLAGLTFQQPQGAPFDVLGQLYQSGQQVDAANRQADATEQAGMWSGLGGLIPSFGLNFGGG